LAISWSSESSLPQDMLSSSFVSPSSENEVFRCILACHSSSDPPRAMLESALAHENPFLAVLASCYEVRNFNREMVQLKIITCLNFQNSSPIDCLGTWIVTSLSKNTRGMIEHEVGGCLHTWNEINIPNLWLIALRNNFVGTLAMSLDVFLPVRFKCFIFSFFLSFVFTGKSTSYACPVH